MDVPPFKPVAGDDYPRTWSQFSSWFPDQAACLTYLERLRWRDGFECPTCAIAGEPYRNTRGRLTCRHCKHDATVIAGTIFEGPRTPLPVWFAAIWYVTSQKHGVSALGLQRALGFASYQTSWAMLHKLRRAMVRPEREQLAGKVEVDETYVGGEEPGVRGRETERKAIVLIAVEVRKSKGFGRVRLRQVGSASSGNILPFVRETKPGSVVCTDGWRGYSKLTEHGYHQFLKNQRRSGEPAHALLPGPHRVASLLKRWLLGTHQGAVRTSHLDYYLDEFTFRFNRRSSGSRGLLFFRLLEQAVRVPAVPYKKLISPQ